MATHRTLAELLGKTAQGEPLQHPRARPQHDPDDAPEGEPVATETARAEPATAEQPGAGEAAEPWWQASGRHDRARAELEWPDRPDTAAVPDTAAAPGPASREPAEPGPGRATSPAPGPEPASAETAARVHTPDSGAAERVTLYLHPDDHRALGLAKLDDRIDHNTRIRAMIALWRADPDAVDRLAARHKAS